MKTTGRCPKCESTRILPGAMAVDKGHYDSRRKAEVTTFAHPEAIIFKGARSSTVSAWVCLSCGFIEYYADAPGSLETAES